MLTGPEASETNQYLKDFSQSCLKYDSNNVFSWENKSNFKFIKRVKCQATIHQYALFATEGKEEEAAKHTRWKTSLPPSVVMSNCK